MLPLAALVAHAHAQQMQQVEVAGSRSEARRQDSAAVTSIGRDELLRHGDRSIAEALQRAPGVSVQGGDIRMRGLGGGYTQILLNGDPVPAGIGAALWKNRTYEALLQGLIILAGVLSILLLLGLKPAGRTPP